MNQIHILTLSQDKLKEPTQHSLHLGPSRKEQLHQTQQQRFGNLYIRILSISLNHPF